MNTNLDTVQAALYFAKSHESSLSRFCWPHEIIEREITDLDRGHSASRFPRLAAAARILADEVERLRAELNTNKTIIEHELNTKPQ